MIRLRLVHWNQDESQLRAEELRDHGFVVDAEVPSDGPSFLQLERRIDRLVRLAENGGLWIAWPKKAAGLRTDVTQQLVRQVGLAAGLVDFKICSINDVWSGLRFTQRM